MIRSFADQKGTEDRAKKSPGRMPGLQGGRMCPEEETVSRPSDSTPKRETRNSAGAQFWVLGPILKAGDGVESDTPPPSPRGVGGAPETKGAVAWNVASGRLSSSPHSSQCFCHRVREH